MTSSPSSVSASWVGSAVEATAFDTSMRSPPASTTALARPPDVSIRSTDAPVRTVPPNCSSRDCSASATLPIPPRTSLLPSAWSTLANSHEISAPAASSGPWPTKGANAPNRHLVSSASNVSSHHERMLCRLRR